MRLTKDFHERLEAEALSKIDAGIRKDIRDFSKAMSNDRSYYLSKEELAELPKVSKFPKWLRSSGTLRVDKSFMPKEFDTWYDSHSDSNRGWFISYGSSYIEIGIEVEYIPHDMRHFSILYSVSAYLQPIFQKLIRRDRLVKELRSAARSCTTVKKLKQILVGIEKLAPKTIKNLEENPMSSQLPVKVYDLNVYADLSNG